MQKLNFTPRISALIWPHPRPLLIDPTEDQGKGHWRLQADFSVGSAEEGKTHNEPLRVGALALVSPNTQGKSLETQRGAFRRECYFNFG